MRTLAETLRADADAVEKALEEWLPARPDDPAGSLCEAMRYASLGGGKRLRGHLALTFCALYGGERRSALPYAAAVEMMHAFSLVHDDLPSMDNDLLRRGKPSCHAKYGEAVALLAGDALALRALYTASRNPFCGETQNLLAAKLLSAAAGDVGMCGGQQMDLQSEGKTLSLPELTELVDRKTGALFAASCELGLLAANVTDDAARTRARGFGEAFGLAFQIADDLLDLHATAETLGKTPGKDAQSGKATFPALLGEEAAARKAENCRRKACELLESAPDGDEKESLRALCAYALTRKM